MINTKDKFIFNKPEYSKATILITGDNFGAGSSQEHAAWALADYGFKSRYRRLFLEDIR